MGRLRSHRKIKAFDPFNPKRAAAGPAQYARAQHRGALCGTCARGSTPDCALAPFERDAETLPEEPKGALLDETGLPMKLQRILRRKAATPKLTGARSGRRHSGGRGRGHGCGHGRGCGHGCGRGCGRPPPSTLLTWCAHACMCAEHAAGRREGSAKEARRLGGRGERRQQRRPRPGPYFTWPAPAHPPPFYG